MFAYLLMGKQGVVKLSQCKEEDQNKIQKIQKIEDFK